MKTRILFTYLILIFGGSMIFAQEKCTIPKAVQDGKFDFVIPKDRVIYGNKREGYMNINTPDKHVIYVKTPATLKEIKERKDIIDCDGITFLPGSSAITEIRTKEVKNLPPGINYRVQKVMKGGEGYCLILEGTATKKGVYNAQISLEGDGKFMGVTKTVQCRMNNFKIHVK